MNKLASIRCNQCNAENDYYEISCKNCKAFIREKIVNIDLGDTLLRLIDSPTEAFRKIVLSEHKNYIYFLILLVSIRFAIISRFMSVPFISDYTRLNNFQALAVFLIFSVVLFYLLAFLIKRIFNFSGKNIRLKDILALLVYSMIPQTFALIILFPIELILYGEYLFSSNPYPFQIKASVFYFLFTLEIFSIIWSILLLFIGLKLFFDTNFKTIIMSFVISSLLIISLFIMSKIYILYEN